MPAAGSGGVRRLPAAADGVERRPPLALVRWQRVDAVPGPPWLRCTRGHQGLGAVLAGPSPVLRLYDQLEPSPGVGDLLREIDRPDRGLPGIGAIQAEASAQCRYLTVPLPAMACPAPCSLGHEQFRDLTSCARLSPEPGGRDLAGVALADCL